MLLGPIFHVELVSIARRGRYFFLRALYGLLILLVMWVACDELSIVFGLGQRRGAINQYAVVAAAFFSSYTVLQMLAILAVGPAIAVGTIATERERRTIEYLFTTDLRNHEIVLGKLFARLGLLFQLVLVGLPILFIFRLLGGIPTNVLVASFLFAGSTALLLVSIGVCVSVWSNRSRDATIRVYLILAALLFLPPLLMTLSSAQFLATSELWQSLVVPVLEFLVMLNPFAALGNMLIGGTALGFGLDMWAVFSALRSQFLLSVVLILLAIFAVRRVHLRESSQGTTNKSLKRKFALPQWRPPLGIRPVMWKEMFAGSARMKLGVAGYIAAALILFTIIGFTIYAFLYSALSQESYRKDDFFEFLIGLQGIVGTGILLLLASRAASLFTEEKERDTWLSLISTPLSGSEIIRGKLLGNLYSMRWAYGGLFICCGLGVFLQPNFIFCILFQIAVLGLFSWYVTSVGLFYSLKSKTSLRAMGSTLATLLFTGGGYLFCCCVGGMRGGGLSEIIPFAPCIPFLLVMPIAVFEGKDLHNEDDIVAALVFGLLGYSAVTFVLQFVLLNVFDQESGRGTEVLREWERPVDNAVPTT